MAKTLKVCILKPVATIEKEANSYTVWTDWVGNKPLDRSRTFGISTGSNKRLADRLARAINDGAVFYNPVIKSDVAGNTYVSADRRVMGRYLNADLKRLGY